MTVKIVLFHLSDSEHSHAIAAGLLLSSAAADATMIMLPY